VTNFLGPSLSLSLSFFFFKSSSVAIERIPVTQVTNLLGKDSLPRWFSILTSTGSRGPSAHIMKRIPTMDQNLSALWLVMLGPRSPLYRTLLSRLLLLLKNNSNALCIQIH
jgi:hypothetical protein